MLPAIKYNTIVLDNRQSNHIFIKVPEVVYAIQRGRKYEICVHNNFTNEVNTYSSYGKVNNYESFFVKQGFIRAKKFLWVNPLKVSELEDGIIRFDCGKEIKIGRDAFAAFSNNIMQLLNKKEANK